MINFFKHTQNKNKPMNENGKKFLTFNLGAEEYAIDILHVQEIKGSKQRIQLSSILEAPPYIKGLLYLHEEIIPVIDLRIFYQLKPAEHNEFNVIMVLKVNNKVVGLAVDSVIDIVELSPEQIKHSLDIFSIVEHDYIDGIGTFKSHLLMILNIEKLINSKVFQLEQQPDKINLGT